MQTLRCEPEGLVKYSYTQKSPRSLDTSGFFNGAGNRTRTDDLRITNALLYQLSHTSGYLVLRAEDMPELVALVFYIKPRIKSSVILANLLEF